MIKNQTLVRQILEMIDTLQEASKNLYESVLNKEYINFIQVSNDMNDVINVIYSTITKIKEDENTNINVDLACENASYSLNRIVKLSKSRSKKILDKIEFELIPIFEDMYLQLYFWGTIYPDKKKIHDYYENELVSLCSNKYINESEKTGVYKYDLSIIVVGYNKLEYTKLCIENLLKHIPTNINYELILLNHGSVDNTKEYFEDIAPTKQIDILRNGGSPTATERVVEGKYCLSVSNDVIVTENSIINMIKCIESDENIAWIVPTTPNMCNNQTIPAEYNTIEEMHEFAKINNKCDEYRWEQRARLCNPIDLKNSKIWYSEKGIAWGGYFHTLNSMIAPDEKVSLIFRRKGYKMILAKDAYCYHYGGVTRSDEIKNHKDKQGNIGPQAFYSEARREFLDIFGVDPLGVGVEFDPNLFKSLSLNDESHVDILGINCGVGSTPLKIKESLKENVHNLDVEIYNVTDEINYMQDLKGISDMVEFIDNCELVESIFSNKKFNYIVIESKLETYANPAEMIIKLKNRLVDNGTIIIKTDNNILKEKIKNLKFDTVDIGLWIILK